MSDNQPENSDELRDEVQEAIKDRSGVGDSLKDKASGAAVGATGAASSLRDKAAAAKASMTDAADSLKDKATGGDSPSVTDSLKERAEAAKAGLTGGSDAAAGAVEGTVEDGGGLLGGMKGRAAAAAAGATGAAAAMKGKAGDAASGVVGGVSGAAGSMKDSVGDAASSATGAAAGVVSGATEKASAAGAAVTASASATAPSMTDGGAGVGGSVGGSGGSSGGSGGSGGGSGNGDDDDDEGFIGGIPISGSNQIIGLGLLVAALFFFGSTISGWFFGDDDAVDIVDAIADVDDPRCAAVLDALEDSALDADEYSRVSCVVRNGEVALSGPVGSDDIRSSVGAAAAAATLGAASIDVDWDGLTVRDADVDEVEEIAAEVTTTTAAPETTTTAAPETTTTEAPAYTMWDAVNDSGQAGQFAVIGGALGLQPDLEALVEEDGAVVDRTLFALSDESMEGLDLAALSADPEGAQAFVGYHFINERLTAADLIALDGQTITTRTGLPMSVAVVDGQVVLNGDSVVIASDFEADNGVVHIITPALTPPTVNAVIGLENIEFEVNSAVITAAGQAELQKAIAFFTETPGVNARIEGHTDTDGSDEANLDLSTRRAASVKQFLVDNGVDEGRLTTIGFGETQPILEDGVENKALSRRIEFNVR